MELHSTWRNWKRAFMPSTAVSRLPKGRTARRRLSRPRCRWRHVTLAASLPHYFVFMSFTARLPHSPPPRRRALHCLLPRGAAACHLAHPCPPCPPTPTVCFYYLSLAAIQIIQFAFTTQANYLGTPIQQRFCCALRNYYITFRFK